MIGTKKDLILNQLKIISKNINRIHNEESGFIPILLETYIYLATDAIILNIPIKRLGTRLDLLPDGSLFPLDPELDITQKEIKDMEIEIDRIYPKIKSILEILIS